MLTVHFDITASLSEYNMVVAYGTVCQLTSRPQQLYLFSVRV